MTDAAPNAPHRQPRRDRRAHHPRGEGARASRPCRSTATADADSLAVKLADEAVDIGPAAATKSYLNIEAILTAAREQAPTRSIPGYGFLAENADFADAVAAAGLVFVGPTAEAIRLMGDKVAARRMAARGRRADRAGQRRPGRRIRRGARGRRRDRLPGHDQGRGRRRRARHPHRQDSARSSSASSRRRAREAQAAFGDGGLYHREGHRAGAPRRGADPRRRRTRIHCFERECSLQRRRQKVWEEAPSRRAAGRRARQRSAHRRWRSPRRSPTRGAGTRRISLRRREPRVLLHRDEHAHPGRASRHRDDHRARSRRGDAPHRRRRAAAHPPGRHQVARPCHRVPHQRGGPGARLHAGSRHRQPPVVPGGPGVRFDTMLYPGLHGAALLRLAARQAHRPGRGPRGVPGAAARGARRATVGGMPTTSRCISALAADPDVRRGRFDTRWLEDWLETKFAARAEQREGGGLDEEPVFASAATSTSSSRSTRACRSRPSSRACR